NRGQPDGTSPIASVPVLASLRDFGMIDPDRMKVFDLIGRTHGLFGGVAEWPTRDEVLEQVSSGKCPNAHEAFRDVARGPGGFVDKRRGMHWAVRLIPKSLTGDDGRYHLFAFAREMAAAYLEPDKRVLFNKEKKFQLGWFPEDAWREHLSQVAKRLRFFRSAGRLLWYLHGRVLALGSVKLLLSDVELASVVWGQDRERWHANWRQHLYAVLASLLALSCGELVSSSSDCLRKDTWMPLLDFGSSELSTAPDFQDRCAPECLLWHSPEKHSHFAITLSGEFLGRLDRFRDGDDDRYDFYPDAASERKRIAEWFREGSIAHLIDSREVKEYLREQKALLKESLE